MKGEESGFYRLLIGGKGYEWLFTGGEPQNANVYEVVPNLLVIREMHQKYFCLLLSPSQPVDKRMFHVLLALVRKNSGP